jgi:hypothetical protein
MMAFRGPTALQPRRLLSLGVRPSRLARVDWRYRTCSTGTYADGGRDETANGETTDRWTVQECGRANEHAAIALLLCPRL